eukprot:m.362269 g.362269  ORF g.362269 m.362269 type:complete len:280 (-) comp20785_c0_seq59:108-947(-)
MLIVYFIIGGVGVMQLPLLVDVLGNAFPDLRITRLSNKFIGYTLGALVYAIACAGYFVYFTIGLPLWIAPQESLLCTEGLLHLFLASWVWILVMYNYTAGVVTHPGHAKIAGDEKPSMRSKSDEIRAKTPDDILNYVTRGFHCKPCGASRTALTYHCSDCGICGDTVDHHCPFLNTCVGRRNFGYFVWFLVWGTIGMSYIVVLTWHPFRECWIDDANSALCHEHGGTSLVFLGAVYVTIPSCDVCFHGVCSICPAWMSQIIDLGFVTELIATDAMRRRA